MSAVKSSQKVTQLQEAMIALLSLCRESFTSIGLVSTHFTSIYKRTTIIRIANSPVVVEDGEFRAEPAGEAEEKIIKIFVKTFVETLRSMAAVWGVRIISDHYKRLYIQLCEEFGDNKEASKFLPSISPDKFKITRS